MGYRIRGLGSRMDQGTLKLTVEIKHKELACKIGSPRKEGELVGQRKGHAVTPVDTYTRPTRCVFWAHV